jgi:DNA-binding response OmpR family regulator
MPKKIVIIEDEENLGKLIRSFLEQHHFEAVHVRDGTEGLNVIRQSIPDLIMVDLLLPGVHGFEVCRRIKDDNKLNNIPMIVMSAVYKKAADKLQVKQLGVDEFVEKPLDFEALLKIINRLTGMQSETKPKPEPEKSEAARQHIQDLRQNYSDQLPDKIDDMERIWGEIQNNTDNKLRFAKLRRMTHTLIGSAETFGFDDITKYARELELVLDMVIVEGDRVLESKKEEIDRLLDNMRLHPLVATGRQLKNMKL